MAWNVRATSSAQLEESKEESDVEEWHGRFFQAMASDLRCVMWGHHALGHPNHCQLELSDLRRAFEHALLTEPPTALTIANGLYALWPMRDLVSVGRR